MKTVLICGATILGVVAIRNRDEIKSIVNDIRCKMELARCAKWNATHELKKGVVLYDEGQQ